MEIWQALLLGIIEGLTEYLPVSSTGHLLVAQRLLGIPEDEASHAYAIAIQAGAILAVLGLYRVRVARMVHGALGRDTEGARLLMALGLAFLPAAVLGLTAEPAIEAYLFGAWPVVTAWAAGGVLILVVAPRLRREGGLALESVGPRVALLIGLAQCAALWPGVSRSLATILGGLAAGLSMVAAVEFSFLLGLVTLGAATAYKAVGSGGAMLEAYGALPLAAGFVAAWASATLAVRWMVAYLSRHGLAVFGWWRILVAMGVGVLLVTGRL